MKSLKKKKKTSIDVYEDIKMGIIFEILSQKVEFPADPKYSYDEHFAFQLF